MNLKQIGTGLRLFREQGVGAVARRLLQKLATPTEVPGSVAEGWTDYLNWLSYANAGMMVRGNVYCFDYAIKNLPSSAPILEIGSFCGLSTNVITHMKEKYAVKNPLVTCDKWVFEGAEHGGMLGDSSSLSHADYRQFVRETYIRNVKMFSRYDLPYTIEAFSDEFFELWASGKRQQDILGRDVSLGGPVSFCFIDGNHSYDYAKRDYINADMYLERGGFLLFDDSGDGSGWDVSRVAQEVLKTNRYELVAKNPNYFLQKK